MSANTSQRVQNEVVDFVEHIKAHENYVLRRPGGKRATLRHVNVIGVRLGRRRLDDIDFSGAILRFANFEGANLSGASLSCADLTKANLSGAILNQADLRGAKVKGANFDNAQLEKADFRQATIARLDRADRWSVIGENQTLTSVSFENCSLRGARLNNANLKDANFNGALLSGASFKGATLGNATFEGAVLVGVHLSEICVSRDRLRNCIFDPEPQVHMRLPKQIVMIEDSQNWALTGGQQGSRANLDSEDIRLLVPFMRGKHLTGISCNRTIAIGGDLSGCAFQAAKFDDADLRGVSFVRTDCRGASFRGANLAHADFSNANLLPLELRNGKTLQADFEGAILDRCKFDGAQRAPKPMTSENISLL